jgi:hypothetical protein
VAGVVYGVEMERERDLYYFGVVFLSQDCQLSIALKTEMVRM